jgi:hypothetical protein
MKRKINPDCHTVCNVRQSKKFLQLISLEDKIKSR